MEILYKADLFLQAGKTIYAENEKVVSPYQMIMI